MQATNLSFVLAKWKRLCALETGRPLVGAVDRRRWPESQNAQQRRREVLASDETMFNDKNFVSLATNGHLGQLHDSQRYPRVFRPGIRTSDIQNLVVHFRNALLSGRSDGAGERLNGTGSGINASAPTFVSSSDYKNRSQSPPIGKHKGRRLHETSWSYLRWCRNNVTESRLFHRAFDIFGEGVLRFAKDNCKDFIVPLGEVYRGMKLR
ncbi:hypothetical protein BKA70DRAFT_1418555 [Coprinopsis sp. MPI-PUGE-AT-0042]|nr:hypothetical protein BKA70DRAFT_1418555 [Coprinopsis sp. MPI-PUGE-AT-0042]